MKYTILTGKDINNDVDIIRRDFDNNGDLNYALNSPGTKLWSYIDCLNQNGIDDDVMFRLKICHEIKGLDLSYIADDSEKEEQITSFTALLDKLDGRNCRVIVNDNKRSTLASVAQQLIYMNYPLPMVNIMLRDEAKDAEKTKRFMKKIDNLSDAIDNTIFGMKGLYNSYNNKNDISAEERQKLTNIISEAQGRCIEIQEQIQKAKDVEMIVAVAASKKTGKSVIVNSMIGEEIAPTSLTLPTPNTCVYKKSRDNLYHLTYKGKTTDYSLVTDIKKTIYEEFDKAQKLVENGFLINDMEIEYVNSGNNFDTFTIFDTPGPNAAGTDHLKAAVEAIKKSDVAIFAIDYTKSLTDNEVKYLKYVKDQFNRNMKFDSLIFTINKMDERFIDPGATKSTIRAIDYIRDRLIMIGDGAYNDCIVFATSALQYYNTLDCEKNLGDMFGKADDLNDLRSMARECTNKIIRNELTTLDGILGHYYVDIGLKKVPADDLKRYSGIPDLLDYTSYICKAKARHEIVNNITVKIDTHCKALKAIIDRIENIEKLINGDKEQIERIKSIIDEYNTDMAPLISTNVYKQELIPTENYARLCEYFEDTKKEEMSLDEIKDIIGDKTRACLGEKTELEEGVFSAVNETTYVKLKQVLEKEKDPKGRIWSDSLTKALENTFSGETIQECLNTVINDLTDDVNDQQRGAITDLKDNITNLLNARIAGIHDKSKSCEDALKKENIPLELPQLPEFTYEMPTFEGEKLNIEDTKSIRLNAKEFESFAVSQKESGFVTFFAKWKEFFNGNDKFGEKLYKLADISKDNYNEEFKKQHYDIVNIIRETKLYEFCASTVDKQVEECDETIDAIKSEFTDMLKAISGSVKSFTDLIDDSQAHKENIESHEREKELIRQLIGTSNEFTQIWDNILSKIERKEGTQ